MPLTQVRGLAALAMVVASLFLLAGAAPASADATLHPLARGVHANGIVTGPDGNIWFAGSSYTSFDGIVGQVTPDGTVTEYLLPAEGKTDWRAEDIAVGSDGNLWFTVPEHQLIGRITVDGAITWFPVPTFGGRTTAIASGPDGNLWFTEEAASKIGRITPAGGITEFALAPGREPAGIVAGPDGAMWFTEKGADRIGRIAADGTVTEFALPGTDRRPNEIVAGSDGGLWFTQETGSTIGRIGLTGEVAYFPVQTASPGTDAIAAAPNGDIWFTSGFEIGSVTPGLGLSHLSCIDSCEIPPISLTIGPDGGLWFGSGLETCLICGGSTVMGLRYNPGYVGRFEPRPFTVDIGPYAPRVSRRIARVAVTCGAIDGCTGTLRLKRAGITLAKARYEVALQERKSVRLRLTRKAAAILAKRRVITTVAKSWEDGGVEATERVKLRQSRRSG